MTDGLVTNVSIFCTEYRIATSVDPDRTRRVALLVDRQMKEVANSLSLRSVTTIAVLAAVNLADELRREQAHAERVTQSVVSSTDRLSRTLNA